MKTEYPYHELMLVYTDPLFRIRWFNDAFGRFTGNRFPEGGFRDSFHELPARELSRNPSIWNGSVKLNNHADLPGNFTVEFNPLFDQRNELCGWIGMMQSAEGSEHLLKKAGMLISRLLAEKPFIPAQEFEIRRLISQLEQLLPEGEKELPTNQVTQIWIVDDDSVIAYVTRRLIHSVDPGMEIREFLSAKMALEKLRIDGVAPDLILLDINMPGITGWSFLDQLNQQNRQVAVYMYSSSIDPEDVKRARGYEVVRDFLPKPLDAKTIRRLLNYPDARQKVS